MTLYDTLLTPAPYHIISYSFLTGSIFYQSFIGGTVAFKALPRPAFSQLQKKIFPIYFGLQTIGPILLYLTKPPSADVTPFLIIGLTALANLLLVSPKTTQIMIERKQREAKEGKNYWDEGISDELRAMNRKFGIAHGVSSLLNLATLVGCLWHGVILADRLV